MSLPPNSKLRAVLTDANGPLVPEWVRQQVLIKSKRGLLDERELRAQCGDLARLLGEVASSDALADKRSPLWQPVHEMLGDLSRTRARDGFSPSETASFVFSLKKVLFEALGRAHAGDKAALADDVLFASELLDELGLYTTEVFQKAREEVISRQQDEMMELSTPVVKLWDGILALPVIGTLDSHRTQVVMETLLGRIVETGAAIAILDITGVPTVDTLTAQHLLKTISAARLMGAECIISGIRPQIAQTIVHLGVDLGDVTTKASLADAFILALGRTGYHVAKKGS